MGRIEADIALESLLFRFRPCSEQGQFTLNPWSFQFWGTLGWDPAACAKLAPLKLAAGSASVPALPYAYLTS